MPIVRRGGTATDRQFSANAFEEVSRLRRFVHGVASGYVSMAAAIITSLVTVPLALHYLSKENFGLWSLLSQIVSYFMLIDFGMSASVARLLVERKDQQDDGGYYRLVHTAFLVGLVQAVIIGVIGIALAPVLASLFKIPADSDLIFRRLVQWQTEIVATSFITRPFRNLLFAHQRADVANYLGSVGLIVGLAILALFLYLGYGVTAVLWSNAGTLAFISLANWWACSRLRFFPQVVAGSRFAWGEFNELFSYGRDVFIVQIGSLLIITTQPMILSRTLGLEAVAAWSVGSKAFFMVSSLIWQFADLSTPAFSEMIVRGETERLKKRVREMLIFSIGTAAILAVIYAALNTSFVEAWTRGKIHWLFVNDILLGLWMIILAIVHVNSGFILVTKQIGGMRYIYLIEGVVFVLLANYFTPRFGIPAMIGISALCSVLFSGAYGIVRMNRYFHDFFKMNREWLGAPLKAFAVILPVAAGYCWVSMGLPASYRFLVGGVILSIVGGLLLLRYVVPMSVRSSIASRLPSWLKRDAEKWAAPVNGKQ
jgi:O-antigen/teichoic acid export membrane protein